MDVVATYDLKNSCLLSSFLFFYIIYFQLVCVLYVSVHTHAWVSVCACERGSHVSVSSVLSQWLILHLSCKDRVVHVPVGSTDH